MEKGEGVEPPFFTAEKNGKFFPLDRTGMSLKDCQKDFVRKVVCEWYGLFTMPLTIMTREEEEEAFEKAHAYIPKSLWESVNHRTRQAFLWARNDDVDIVIRENGHYKLIQDMFFKDQFDSDKEWREMCMEWIAHTAGEVFVVYHDEVYLA